MNEKNEDEKTLKEKLFNKWSIWWFQSDQVIREDLDSLFKKELQEVIDEALVEQSKCRKCGNVIDMDTLLCSGLLYDVCVK